VINLSRTTPRLCIGKELDDMADIKNDAEGYQGKPSAPVYEATNLCSTEGIQPFNFYIKKGEVNGFTGLLGSGRSESVRAIFGADKVTSGSVKVNGIPVRITKPLEAMKQGIAYLPEDRKRDGIIGDLSVKDNIILALQVKTGFFKPFSKAKATRFAKKYIDLLDIKTASVDTPIKSLSGGNQQKVILGRWLLTEPKYLILDEPTRGIDVGAKYDIYCLMNKMVADGKSVIMISSEMPELLGMCDRIYVMNEGRIVAEMNVEDATQEKIMAAILRSEKNEEGA
jgi:simple sugar transport system ATP-binding protein